MRTNSLNSLRNAAVLACVTALSALLATSAVAAPAPVQIERIGGTPAAGLGSAEISAYLPTVKRAYVTNAADNAIDIVSLANPTNPVKLGSIDLDPYGAGPNSVAVSKVAGGRVLVAVEASPKTSAGKVVMFDRDGGFVTQTTVGALPDMIKANGDRQFVIANEGEPDDSGLDPEGSISVVDLIGANKLIVRNAGFGGVTIPAGVRVFGPDTDPTRNLEPEYVAISPTGLLAYVTLQEANAIAIVDLLIARVIAVKPLGFKDHSLPGNGLDASDRDNAINIANYPNLKGMYQPDAIAMYTLPGKLTPFYITANEGDARDWDYYAEESRVSGLTLDPTAFPDATIKGNSKLGRLNVTKSLGDTDNDGDYDELYSFGGRSVSILDWTGSLKWDSGDMFEQYHAATDPARFNVEGTLGGFDTRSDNKGPEPEGVDTGKVGNRMYAFVGNERQNTLLALDLQDQPGKAAIAGGLNTLPTDESIEGVEFIPANESPNGKPLVLTTNEVSGSLGVFSIKRT